MKRGSDITGTGYSRKIRSDAAPQEVFVLANSYQHSDRVSRVDNGRKGTRRVVIMHPRGPRTVEHHVKREYLGRCSSQAIFNQLRGKTDRGDLVGCGPAQEWVQIQAITPDVLYSRKLIAATR